MSPPKDESSYKATNGIKRHLAVDSLGFPFFTHCTRANVSDDQGLIEMLIHNINYFRQKPLELAKTTILLDHGYHTEKIQTALEQVYPQIMTKIQFELSAKPEEGGKGSSREIWLCTCGSALGEASVPIAGWNDARIWSKTLSGP